MPEGSVTPTVEAAVATAYGLVPGYEELAAAMRSSLASTCRVQVQDDSFNGWRSCNRTPTTEGTVLDWPVCAECLEAIR